MTGTLPAMYCNAQPIHNFDCPTHCTIFCIGHVEEKQDPPSSERLSEPTAPSDRTYLSGHPRTKMGQEYSAEDGAPTTPTEPVLIDTTTDYETLSGYRVMKVFQGSPASRSGLSPFEDFIVAINGAVITSDNASLSNVLKSNEGNEVALIVWNCIDNQPRDVALRPVKWNGPGLLGAAVRYEPIHGAADNVQRVMDVLPASPADEAGLMPNTDYIVGTPAEVFRKENDFGRLVNEALERKTAASFMVYSTATNRTRIIEIRPDRHWGGQGSLGCQLATGLLHRITRST